MDDPNYRSSRSITPAMVREAFGIAANAQDRNPSRTKNEKGYSMPKTTARDAADRIGLEVERDAALAEVVRLRGIIDDTVGFVVENTADGDDGESGWVDVDKLLPFIAKALLR